MYYSIKDMVNIIKDGGEIIIDGVKSEIVFAIVDNKISKYSRVVGDTKLGKKIKDYNNDFVLCEDIESLVRKYKFHFNR